MADCDGNGFCFPYDVLLDIFRRLPGGAVTACHCVCRAWRAIIDDDHDLSMERYFPRRAFPGIFVSKTGCDSNSAFFAPLVEQRGSRPVFRRPVFHHGWATVHHSCNGLLLLEGESGGYYVCNPATVRIARLPYLWLLSKNHGGTRFLAFDPAVSLHYEVFVFQEFPPPFVPEPPTKRVHLTKMHDQGFSLYGEDPLSEEEEQDESVEEAPSWYSRCSGAARQQLPRLVGAALGCTPSYLFSPSSLKRRMWKKKTQNTRILVAGARTSPRVHERPSLVDLYNVYMVLN